MRTAFVLGVIALLLHGPADADYSERPEVLDYVDGLAAQHGFAKQELLGTFAEASHQPSIIEAISRPKERTLKWHEYRRIFLKEARIDGGVAFWEENDAALKAAEQAYGVAPEYVVAIIGVETYFGKVMGAHRVLDALATLAFDYPPRADFFRGQLTEFLLLVREEDRTAIEFVGSYAGAMGYGQFIPSSYRSFAVDFDGDGVRDIWTNTTDAIGSVANYFAAHYWRPAGLVALPVQVTQADRADAVANDGLALEHTVDELRALGVQAPDLDGGAAAGLLRMELQDGHEYWLALHNFHVITKYNRSRMYALAVHQLSQAIRDRREAALALQEAHRP